MNIDRFIKIIGIIWIKAPKAKVDTDDTQHGVIRVNYNGPKTLTLNADEAEVLGDPAVKLCDGYAEIDVDK